MLKLKNKAYLNVCIFLLTVGYFLFISRFATIFHPVEETGDADEWYLEQVQTVLNGELPANGYHSILYPIISAGFALLTGQARSGAIVVSNISAAIFLWLSYWITLLIYGWRIAVIVFLFVAFNSTFLIQGVYIAPGMFFGFLALLTIYLCICFIRKPSNKFIILLAFSFSMGVFARNNGHFLIPTIFLTLLGGGVSLRERFRRLMIFFVFSLLFLTPHFVSNYMSYKTILFSDGTLETWAMKLYHVRGYQGYYPFMPKEINSVWSLFKHDGFRIVTGTFESLYSFFRFNLPAYLGIDMHPGFHFTHSGVFFCFLAGIFYQFRTKNLEKRIIAITWIFYLVGVCFVIYPMQRILLFWIVLSYMLILDFLFNLENTQKSFFTSRVVWAMTIVFLVFLENHYKLTKDFINRHPKTEIAVAKKLENIIGKSGSVAGTFAFLCRHVSFKYSLLPILRDDETGNLPKYFARLREDLLESKTDYVLIGKVSLGDRPETLLSGEKIPYLKKIYQNDKVTLFRNLLNSHTSKKFGSQIPNEIS